MDINLLKKLIKLVEQSEITDFSVHEGDLKVRISKNADRTPHGNQSSQIDNGRLQTQHLPQLPGSEQTQAAASSTQEQTKLHEVKSPIVGTFYRAPSPDADPYIQIGDSVSPGSVLCIVEAMKLMNEIECDAAGKVVKILVENASPVEYNQPLFLIETA
jgi:acetyl-CoA carboxylase biotin carboxyl carrier protein